MLAVGATALDETYTLSPRHHEFLKEWTVWLLEQDSTPDHQATGNWVVSAGKSPVGTETVGESKYISKAGSVP